MQLQNSNGKRILRDIATYEPENGCIILERIGSACCIPGVFFYAYTDFAYAPSVVLGVGRKIFMYLANLGNLLLGNVSYARGAGVFRTFVHVIPCTETRRLKICRLIEVMGGVAAGSLSG
jgi:hypothetical protein